MPIEKETKAAKAVFLDRDGVVNELALNPANGEWESPHHPGDLVLAPDAREGLSVLRDAGYLLFLVSNQPSYAKGKTSLEDIQAIHGLVHQALRGWGIRFQEYYYCYHHPDGVVAGYQGPCPCRKPSPFFLFKARDEHGVDLARSWMVGDQDTDIQCGQAAGSRTALLENPHSAKKRGASRPDFTALGLAQAARRIAAQG